MLTSDQFDVLTDPVSALYEEYIQIVLNDIAKRLANGSIASASWKLQRLIESGEVYKNAIKELSTLTGKSQRELRKIFEKAGVTSMQFDDEIYRAAGMDPLPLNLSPAMLNTLNAGLSKTQGIVDNFTLTGANDARDLFIHQADLAYLRVTTGTASYDQAIREAIKNVASNGLSMIDYSKSHKDKLDVAMRRAVLTGVSQTAAKLQLDRAREMGQDLVQTSAHIGARPSHQVWQGQIFSLSGNDPDYPMFVTATGFGTGAGLCGWNCRHSFYPFFKGISENAYTKAQVDAFNNKKVLYNGREVSAYEATQIQRSIERKIRDWKRQEQALQAADFTTIKETMKVREWQATMREFIRQTKLDRQYIRERI